MGKRNAITELHAAHRNQPYEALLIEKPAAAAENRGRCDCCRHPALPLHWWWGTSRRNKRNHASGGA
jgi:hypothetical protein